jgi:hypothetical protein
MFGVQPVDSWKLRFPLLITFDGLRGRLYDGHFVKPFGTDLS